MRAPVIEGVVAVIERDGQWLAIRRAAGIAAAGFWCFPGGAIEPGESIEAALVREVREEVGLDVQPAQELWQWRRDDGQLILRWWSAMMNDPSQPVTLDPREASEYLWIAPNRFDSLVPLLDSNVAFIAWHREQSVPPHHR